MSRIRILVAGVPRLLRDILESAIRAQPDMELVPAGEEGDLSGDVSRQRPDVIIVADEAGDLSVARLALVSALPRLGVVTLARGGREARFIDVRRVPVRDTSPQGLVESIRTEFSHQERS